jgi:hypothetical protein
MKLGKSINKYTRQIKSAYKITLLNPSINILEKKCTENYFIY